MSTFNQSPDEEHSIALPLGLALATFFAYCNSFFAPFVFDDLSNILRNDQLANWWPQEGSLLIRRPVGHLSFAMNHAFGGMRVFGFHVMNFAIHLTAGLTLFGVARRCLQRADHEDFRNASRPLAFGIALLWLVHPIQTESVTYVVQRLEAMSGLFYLLCLYGLIRSVDSKHPLPWQILVVASFWLGIGTKESMVTGLLVLPLFDRAFMSNSWREVVRCRGLVYLACVPPVIWLFSSLVVYLDPDVNATVLRGPGVPSTWEYLRTQAGVIVHYLQLVIWPQHLSLDYDWPIAQSALEIYLPGAVILVLLVASFVAYIRAPRLGFVGLAFFFVLAPTSSFAPIKDLAVEHRMYLPLAAALALLVLAVFQLALWAGGGYRQTKPILRIMLVVATGALIVRTFARNEDYRSPIAMWESAIHVNPRNARAHYNLGWSLEMVGQAQKAQTEYRQTIEIKPNHVKAYNNLAILRAREGDVDEAERLYLEALRRDPSYARARDNYGNLLARQGEFSQAIVQYQHAVDSDPNLPPAWQHLALALHETGDAVRAVSTLRNAQQRFGDSTNWQLSLAWILATARDKQVRDGAEAVRLAEQAHQALGENFKALDVLGAAYASAGEFDRAVECADKAVRVAGSHPSLAGEKAAIEHRSRLYRQSKQFIISLN